VLPDPFREEAIGLILLLRLILALDRGAYEPAGCVRERLDRP
jgi:hypothetical protein